MIKEQWHQSQRGYFAGALHEQMSRDRKIWLLSVDLGYKVFDKHFEQFSDRCINTGAAEQTALDIAVGLALEGQKPFIYTITPFFLRGFETIRTYINHENIPVRLIGSGRDRDYSHDGISHWAEDFGKIIATQENIKTYWPQDKDQVPGMVSELANLDRPAFLSLSR